MGHPGINTWVASLKRELYNEYIKHLLLPHPGTAVSPADHAYDCPEAVLPPALLRHQGTPTVTLTRVRAPLSWTRSPWSCLGDTRDCHLQHTACCWGFLYTHSCEMWCTAILPINCVSLKVVVDIPHCWTLSPPPPLAIYLVGCFHPPQGFPTLTPLPTCHCHNLHSFVWSYLHIVIIIAGIGWQTGRGDILAKGNGLAQSDNGIVIWCYA